MWSTENVLRIRNSFQSSEAIFEKKFEALKVKIWLIFKQNFLLQP